MDYYTHIIILFHILGYVSQQVLQLLVKDNVEHLYTLRDVDTLLPLNISVCVPNSDLTFRDPMFYVHTSRR